MTRSWLLHAVLVLATAHGARILSSLEDEWRVQLPSVTIDSENNSVTMDFNVSDFISVENTRAEIFKKDCEEPQLLDGINVKGFTDPGILEFQLDMKTMVKDPEIFSFVQYPSRASLDICIRYMLWTGPESDPDALEVNYFDTILTIYIDMIKGFVFEGDIEIEEKPPEYGDKNNITEEDEFEAAAYLCDSVTFEEIKAPNNGFIPGHFICICAEMNAKAIEEGLYLLGVAEFKWTRTYYEFGEPVTTVQYSIQDFDASDSLTIYDCPELATFCTFKTLLQADFYALPGDVFGEGYIQFAFAPGSRKLHRSLGIQGDGRSLQSDPNMQFRLPVRPLDERGALIGTSGGGSVKFESFLSFAIVSFVTAMIHCT